MLTSRSDAGLPCNKFKIAFKPSDVIIAKGTFHTKSFLVLDDTLSSESLCKSKLSISKELDFLKVVRLVFWSGVRLASLV